MCPRECKQKLLSDRTNGVVCAMWKPCKNKPWGEHPHQRCMRIANFPQGYNFNNVLCLWCPFSLNCTLFIMIFYRSLINVANTQFITLISHIDILTANVYKFQVQRTIETFIHPSWTGKFRNGSDIALLKLEEPFQEIKMPTLADEYFELLEGIILTIVGWPSGGLTGPILRAIQHVDIPLDSAENCQNVYNFRILDSMLCAGGTISDTLRGKVFILVLHFCWCPSSSVLCKPMEHCLIVLSII